MPTLTLEQIHAIRWEEAKRNVQTLEACKMHYFPKVDIINFTRSVCVNCGGEMHPTEIRHYVLGFIAAGGDPNKIVEGW